MARNEYSASAVKHQYWFNEFRQTVKLLNDGRSFANYILRAINPTINVQAIDIARMPLIVSPEMQKHVTETSDNCIELSKCDWDSFETSWDFRKHPLI